MNLSTECCSCRKQFGRLLCKANKPAVWGFISLHPPLNKGEERWLYSSVNVCIIFNDWKPGGISITERLFFFFKNFKSKAARFEPFLSFALLGKAPITLHHGPAGAMLTSVPCFPIQEQSRAQTHKWVTASEGVSTARFHSMVSGEAPWPWEQGGQRALPWKSLYLGQLSWCLVT